MGIATDCTECVEGFVLINNECVGEAYTRAMGVFGIAFSSVVMAAVMLLAVLIKLHGKRKEAQVAAEEENGVT